MNDIAKRWKAIGNLAREQELFSKYAEARETYRRALITRAASQQTHVDLQMLLDAEKNAFSVYIAHRLKSRPEQQD